jgi:hypothetical protein
MKKKQKNKTEKQQNNHKITRMIQIKKTQKKEKAIKTKKENSERN